MKGQRDFIPIYVTRPFGTRGSTGRVSLRRGTINAVKFVTLGNVLGWGAYGLVQLALRLVGA